MSLKQISQKLARVIANFLFCSQIVDYFVNNIRCLHYTFIIDGQKTNIALNLIKAQTISDFGSFLFLFLIYNNEHIYV